ncbi:MAG TPA: glycosyltransferase family 4 protein, partial [Solirubrobacter sp.]|nr:glycosyltransferase family 4 protein [Solirubrobacter sp.]
ARLGRGPRRPPVVGSFQGVARGEYRAAARLLRSADRVACVSEELAAELARAGLPAERLLVIHNAVAAAPAVPGDGDVVAGTSPPLVVAVGRLVSQKNHERLLLAARRVRERGVPASFAVVGGGPLHDRLVARATELGLGDVVRFTGVRTDARAIMARADLVAFSSDWEGLSIAALEALAAGTPVVSTPAHGMRELLGGGAGAVAASMDPVELGDLIADVLGDPRRRAAMGAAGRRLVAERFSSEAMLDAYERLYSEALSARG